MYSELLGTLLELLEDCPLLLLLLQVTNSCIWEDLWPWDLEWFLCPQLLLHFCRLLQHWEHQWCQLHYMEDWFFSVDFCCMTPKRLSIGKTKHVLISFLKYYSFAFWEICSSNIFFLFIGLKIILMAGEWPNMIPSTIPLVSTSALWIFLFELHRSWLWVEIEGNKLFYHRNW